MAAGGCVNKCCLNTAIENRFKVLMQVLNTVLPADPEKFFEIAGIQVKIKLFAAQYRQVCLLSNIAQTYNPYFQQNPVTIMKKYMAKSYFRIVSLFSTSQPSGSSPPSTHTEIPLRLYFFSRSSFGFRDCASSINKYSNTPSLSHIAQFT